MAAERWPAEGGAEDPTPFYRRVRRLEIQAARLVESRFAGSYRSVFRGPGLEFDEVREYVPGDDVRLIDWNVTSRFGAPFTKLFREERELTLFLLVDVSASLFTGGGEVSKFGQACLLTAILALAAERNHDRVGAVFFTDRIERWIPPARGRRHLLHVIHSLLTVRPQGRGSDVDGALRLAGKHMKRRGICLLLSDFRAEGYWDSLGLLARRHDCIAVRISDPVDERFPPTGLLELEDPESGETLLAEGGSAAFRQAYALFWEQRRRQWLEQCRRRRVEVLEVRTDADPGEALVRFFRRRGNGRGGGRFPRAAGRPAAAARPSAAPAAAARPAEGRPPHA